MTRAPLKLTREMKLLLGLLLLVAALGAWYILTRGNAPADEAVSTPVTAPGDTVPVTPSTTAGQPKDGQVSGVSSGDGQVDVAVLPPFPVDGAAPAVTDVPPTPSGINPRQQLASVPATNPFTPLQGDVVAATPAAAAPSSVTAPAAVPTPVPTADVPAVTPLQTGGAVGLGSIPGAGGTTTVTGTGALPIPEIPGANGSANPVVVTPIGAGGPVTTPGTVVSVPSPTGTGGVAGSGGSVSGGSSSGASGSGGTAANGASSAGTGATLPAAPQPAPVAGMTVPPITQLSGRGGDTLSSSGPGSTGSGAAGDATGAGSASSGAVTTLPPTPGTPQVFTDLDASPVPAVTPLESFVKTQNLNFNAVVLGPVNTAIFRSKDGFVVVSVGQNLPDSQVTVKEVTATSATLSLGNDSTILELDKR